MKVSFIEKFNKDAKHVVCLVNEPSMVDVLVDDTMLAAVVKASYKEHGKAHGHFCWSSGNVSENIEIAVISIKKEFDLLHCREIGARLFKCLKSSSGAKRVEVISALDYGKNTEQDVIAQIACGMLLASYNFDKYFTKKQDSDSQCCAEEVCFVTEQAKLLEKDFVHYSCMTSGIFLTRDLVSEPANNLPPAAYLARIKDELEPLGIRVSALNKEEMGKLGMGALLGVAQGSKNDPFTVIMQWNGADDGEYPVALVGKGVTFDSGGLSLKPAKSMEDMKTDMAGSAVVVGALKTLAMRKAKMNIVGIVGLVENMPSGSAQRPGDVVKSLSGQTIEVLNTDAEGRLVLADVLWYAADRFKPAVMIDLATLTGAAVVALGNGCAALMSNDDQLAKQIELSSQQTGETVWRLPLLDEYDKHIDSTIADVRNTSTTSGAGTITAAKFLQRFVKEGVKWAHLDIAAVAWQTSPVKGTNPKGASGFGVELLMNFLYKNYDI